MIGLTSALIFLYAVFLCGLMEILWARHPTKESRAEFVYFLIHLLVNPKKNESWWKYSHVFVISLLGLPMYTLIAMTHSRELKKIHGTTKATTNGE